MVAEHKTPTVDVSHDRPDAVPRSDAAGNGASAAAHGTRVGCSRCSSRCEQMLHQEQPAHEAQTQQGASLNGGNERQSQQLILKGFDNIETFSGGEEQWQNWSWKIKTAISRMNGELAEMLKAAEADGIESSEEVLREAKFVDANRERCVKAGEEMYGVLARYTNSEALTVVKSVSEMDGVKAWRGYMRTTAEERWDECSECNASACIRSL